MILGNAEGKKSFKIPVSWEVFDEIEVQADSLEEALEWAKDHSDEIPLGIYPEYVEGSYEIGDYDMAECLNPEIEEEKEDY